MTIYVITGPPAGGKSTWVQEHAQPGDITIDYDTLAQALSPGLHPDPAEQPPRAVAVIQAARDAAINEAIDQYSVHVAMGEHDVCDVYLVHAMPDRHSMNRYRKHGYQIVVCDPGFDECMRRAAAQRTPRQQAIVEDWYIRRGLAV